MLAVFNMEEMAPAASSGNNEIAFGVSEAGTFVNPLGTLVNEDPPLFPALSGFEGFFSFALVLFAEEHQCVPIRAFEELADGFSGDIGELRILKPL